MAMTTFEKGLYQGRRTTLRELLEARFGPLSPGVEARLEGLSLAQLKALGLALLNAKSLKDLGLED